MRTDIVCDLAPIALFVYNRPCHTRKTLEALQQNILANKSELFIFSDEPKNDVDEDKVKDVRKYIRTLKGFKNITIIERDRNYGLANSFIQGNNEILSQYNKMIGLEDDNLTSPYFLTFMNSALELYKNDDSVICVSGYCFPLGIPLPETYFIKGADTWSYATWRRGWALFEEDPVKIKSQLIQKNRMDDFALYGKGMFKKMLDDQINGKIDSWGVRWMGSAFLHDKYNLYPGRALTRNIGCDGSGVHFTTSTSIFEVNLSTSPILAMKCEVKEDLDIKNAVMRFYGKKIPLSQRVHSMMKKFIGRIFECRAKH